MNPTEEHAFEQGYRVAWRAILSRAIAELGYDNAREACAIAELEAARASCESTT